MKNAGLFVILIFRRKVFEKSTCFLLAGLTKESYCMKKKIIIAICILVMLVLLVPIPMRMKDGGTIKYQALLYSVSDVHRLAPSKVSGYEDGIVIEILGMQVFNNVK